MKQDETGDAETTRRRLTLAVGASALVGGLGRATALTASMPNTEMKFKEGKVVLTDTILALGKLDPATLPESIGDSNPVALLGRAHTYFLAQGGAQLLRIAQELNSDRLLLEPDSHALFMRDQVVWGSVRLTYTTTGGNAPTAPSQDETALLRKLGFYPTGANAFAANVNVKGVVRPPISLSASLPTLHHTREIVLRAPPTTEQTPNLGKFAMLPLAIAIDVALVPVYVFGLLVLGLAGAVTGISRR